MSFAGAIATCSILLLLRVPFAEGQPSEAPSEAFMMEQILSENGCGAFARLVAATAAAGEAFREQMGGTGLTIFCPDDAAVAKFGTDRFNNLTAGDQVALLLYHGVATPCLEEPGISFDGKPRVATLASGPGDYGVLTVRDGDGGGVILSSSHNEARVTKMAVDNDRLVVNLIDAVLVPGNSTGPTDWLTLLVFCIVLFGPPLLFGLLLALLFVVDLLIRSYQDCARAYVSAARVTPHQTGETSAT